MSLEKQKLTFLEGEQAMETKLTALVTHGAVVVLFALLVGWIFGFNEFGGLSFSTSTVAARNALFAWHPLLNIIAFGIAMSEGLIAYKVWDVQHWQRKAIHGVCHAIALFCSILALTAVLVFHNAIGAASFYSMHSWVGLLVYILTWLQFFGALFTYWIPNIVSNETKARIMPFHKFSGLTIYVCSVAAMISGIMQKQSFLRGSSDQFGGINMYSNFLALWILVTAASVLWHVAGPSRKVRQAE